MRLHTMDIHSPHSHSGDGRPDRSRRVSRAAFVVVMMLAAMILAVPAIADAPTPPPPTGLTATANSTTKVTLTWGSAPRAKTYGVFRDGQQRASGITSTSFVDTQVTGGTTYTFKVTACNSSGCSAQSSPASVTTPASVTPPATPTGLTAVANSSTKITASWNSSSGATTYSVYRKGSLLTSGVTTTSYVDSSLAASTTYSYTVAACNSSGCSAQSAPVSVTTPAASLPTTPTGLTAVANSSTKITASWNSSSGATTYSVYRKGSLLTSGVTTTSYVDSSLAASTTYSYTVAACNSSGCSAQSAPVSVTTPAASSCTGVTLSPGTDIQAMINLYPQATTFCLKSGTYPVSVAILVKAYDSVIGEPGAVLDGQRVASRGLWGYGGTTGQHDVTVKGLILQGFTSQAIQAGWNWTVENNEMRDNQIGFTPNTGTVLAGNQIHDNWRIGILGSAVTNVLIESNEIYHNNPDGNCGGSCSSNDYGGVKIYGTVAGSYDVTFRGNWVHDNKGFGFHTDGNVHNALYENNTVENNTRSGIFHEISWDAVIRNNVVRDNASDFIGQSCWHGAQVFINTSKNVEIYGNTVSSTAGANGICLVYANRTDASSPNPTALGNISIHDNTVHMSSTAASGQVGNPASGILFDSDTYDVPSVAGDSWAWSDKYPITWTEFRGRGQELHGTVQ